jgi:small GTP-binding protein
MQKKIVLLGAPGVGKTSLVRQFVESLFDAAYLTTIGVKVDKKQVEVDGQDVTLMLWDIAGAEAHFTVPPSYVRGAAGYLLVVDAIRPATLDDGLDLVAAHGDSLSGVPGILLLNKADLVDDWRTVDAAVAADGRWRGHVIRTSAKTGHGVDVAFLRIAEDTRR